MSDKPGLKLPSFKDVQALAQKRAKLDVRFDRNKTNSGKESNGSTSAAAAAGRASAVPPAAPVAVPFTAQASLSLRPPPQPVQQHAAPPSIQRADTPVAPAAVAQSAHHVPVPRPAAPAVHTPISHNTYSSQVRQGNAILVNKNQQGNPLLKCLRNINYRFASIIPDYLVNDKIAVIFLSLKFHRLQPLYIFNRINALQRAYRTFLLCHCDVDDPEQPLAEVAKAAIDCHCTLITAFSDLECSRYLELLKLYENKTADSLKPRVEAEHTARVANVLTKVRAVNKTDCASMGFEFKTVAAMLRATEPELTAVPGLGNLKVKRMLAAFTTPFRPQAAAAAAAAANVASTGAQDGAAQSSRASTSAAATAAGRREIREWVATQEVRLHGEEAGDEDELADVLPDCG